MASEGSVTEKKSLRERLLEMMGFRNSESEGMSDSEIYRALDKVLFADEPGFLGIDNIFQSDGKVVYAVAPEDKLVLYRREFSVDEQGAVTLGEKEEVTMVTRYEPVSLSAAPCNCNSNQEEVSMDKSKLVAALIACPKNKFTEEDRKGLEALSVTALEALATPEPAPAPAPAPALTPEEVEALLPEATKQLIANARAAAATKKNDLVKSLSDNQNSFSAEELSAMDLVMLEKLAKITTTKRETDFSAKGIPRSASSGEEASIPAAPALSAQFTK